MQYKTDIVSVASVLKTPRTDGAGDDRWLQCCLSHSGAVGLSPWAACTASLGPRGRGWCPSTRTLWSITTSRWEDNVSKLSYCLTSAVLCPVCPTRPLNWAEIKHFLAAPSARCNISSQWQATSCSSSLPTQSTGLAASLLVRQSRPRRAGGCRQPGWGVDQQRQVGGVQELAEGSQWGRGQWGPASLAGEVRSVPGAVRGAGPAVQVPASLPPLSQPGGGDSRPSPGLPRQGEMPQVCGHRHEEVRPAQHQEREGRQGVALPCRLCHPLPEGRGQTVRATRQLSELSFGKKEIG